MTNPNPFVPQGSLLEHQTKSRSKFKWAVSCVLAVSVIGLVAILIQGCKREAPGGGGDSTDLSSMNPTNSPTDMSSNSTDVYSNATPAYGTAPSNAPVAAIPQPPATPVAPVMPVAPVAPVVDTGATAGTEYTVVSGDTLAKIAHAHGVTVKALEAANPGVDPKKLHPKQKLTIPAGGSATAVAGATAADTGAAAVGTSETYVVKSGDTLTKIAKAHHVKVKAIQTANSLATTQIHVGQKLKIPASAEAAPIASNTTTMAPAVPDVNTPPPAPVSTAPAPAAPAPAH